MSDLLVLSLVVTGTLLIASYLQDESLPDGIYIDRSSIHGIGLFTNRPIREGQNIGIGITWYSIITYFGSKINHQYNPNTKLVRDRDGNYIIQATKDIYVGEELTINYNDTPWFVMKPDPSW